MSYFRGQIYQDNIRSSTVIKDLRCPICGSKRCGQNENVWLLSYECGFQESIHSSHLGFKIIELCRPIEVLTIFELE